MAKKSDSAASQVPLKLQGKSVFLAGNFYYRNDDFQNLIKLEGGKVAAELTEKTDIVVLGFSGVSNPQKRATKLNAQGAGIQVLTVDQFGQMIWPTPDEAVVFLRSGPSGIERWNRHCSHDQGFNVYGLLGRQPQRNTTVQGADFSHVDLSGAHLLGSVDQCDFTGADLSKCALNLSNCQLTGARLDGVTFLRLVGCTAENVDFSRIGAENATFESSNLTGSCFKSVSGRRLQFVKCQADRADLAGLQAPQATFRDCSMIGATFAGANLTECDFSQSDLSGVNFSNANLTLAKLTGAKVDDADFTGASITGADVAHVDFSKAKGFSPSQVETKGGAGAAVKEFVKIAAKAQRVSTSLAVTQGAQAAVLTLDVNPSWTVCHDTAGGYYQPTHHHIHATPSLWANMATKWHGAVLDLTSVTVRSTKAPLANKELKQLALRAWCELFGVAPPSEDDLKQSAASTKAQKKEKADEWLNLLRSGKKGIEQWNDNVAALSKMLGKLSGIELANAKLTGIQMDNMEWKDADLSGADLAKAKIDRCRFPNSNFTGTSFKGAKIHTAAFHDANLENADWTSVKSWGVSFKRANCRGANFTKANLESADLTGTDLTGADLSDAILTHASYDEHTRWPKGFSPTLEMTWKGPGTSPAAHKLVQATKPKGKLNIDQFMKRLEELTDAAKLSKALSMLKADRFRLYAQVQDDHFVGVVKSQGDPDLVYSCRLNADGTYACCTQNLNICGGLRGSLCKHLLVLIVGLAKNGELDPNVIDTWIRLSKTNKPALDKEAMSETFLRYKGAEAGEVDWRPTETIPEDYYAM